MPLNLLSLATLAFVAGVMPACAETIVISANSSAEIESHNASSHFLAGAFLPIPADWTDLADTLSTSDNVRPTAPTLLSRLLAVEPQKASASLDTSGSGTPAGSITSGTGPLGGGPSQGIGPVPLPASLPMFGLALLALGSLGYGLRVRRSG